MTEGVGSFSATCSACAVLGCARSESYSRHVFRVTRFSVFSFFLCVLCAKPLNCTAGRGLNTEDTEKREGLGEFYFRRDNLPLARFESTRLDFRSCKD